MIAELPRLHAVTDDRVLARGDVVQRAGEMAEAGGAALAVHLRSSTLGGGALAALAGELGPVLKDRGSWLVVNGRADVARAAGARAVVSGRGGLSVRDIRRVAPSALVLRSVHDAAEIAAAAAEGADALIAGGPAKRADASVIGAATATGRPVIAIGDITAANAGAAIAAGAHGVAAVRALWDAGNVADAVRGFLAVLPKDDRVPVVINGEPGRARVGITLRELLGDLGLDARAVVVEHNRRIVRRDALDQARLAEGDAIELVHFVGGG